MSEAKNKTTSKPAMGKKIPANAGKDVKLTLTAEQRAELDYGKGDDE